MGPEIWARVLQTTAIGEMERKVLLPAASRKHSESLGLPDFRTSG